MKKKVLFVATVDSHIINFHIPYLKMFKEKGYEVHVASNGDSEIPYVSKKHNVKFARSPFKIDQIQAYLHLKKIIKNNKYEIIHCHTPMGSVLTRIAAKNARKLGTKVLYTAHGFHFYKGASIVNWLLYYPVEKYLSRYTDGLITINNEDYNRAKKKFKSTKVYYVPGVGVDIRKYKKNEKDRNELRAELEIKDDDFVMLSVGELNKNKNHQIVVRALGKLKNPRIKYLICGVGDEKENLEELAFKLGVQEQLILLGYRKDVYRFYNIADLFVFPSHREGLSLAMMEAMASGLPVIASNIRGNNELIDDGKGGFLINGDELPTQIKIMYENIKKRIEFGDYNFKKIKKYYSIDTTKIQMKKIYYKFVKKSKNNYK